MNERTEAKTQEGLDHGADVRERRAERPRSVENNSRTCRRGYMNRLVVSDEGN